MKATNTKPGKVEVKVVNGYNLETIGNTLQADGAKLGKEHEAAHVKVSAGLTTSVLAHLNNLYTMRESINLEGSLNVFWSAYITAAPTAYADNKRGKQTKSDTLTICRAWDKGAKFKFAGLVGMVKAARAFLKPQTKDKSKADVAQTETGEQVTPKANNAATADKFIRQQAAMMLAYCDKNKKQVSGAMYHAVAELAEALKAIPAQ